MPSMDEFFGNYLKTEHITEEKDYFIEECVPEEIKSENKMEEKLIVYFQNVKKGLVLNKINADSIAKIADSKDYTTWKGIQLCLYVDPDVKFGAKTVGGIRIKEPLNKPTK